MFLKIPAFILLPLLALSIISCEKPATGTDDNTVINGALNYGDSIFYINAQNYVISPASSRAGTYSAFPANLLIDSLTGKITVAVMGKGGESQTGLRYKILFQDAATNQKDSTYIVLAGINYIDRVYYLSQNDSIISPLYNANYSNAPSGTYGIQADNKLAIDPATGQINIKECIRRGLFNLPAEDGEWEELTVQYKSNDNSNAATNRIDIAIYFYDRLNTVPSNVSSVMRAHQTMVLGVNQPAVPVTTGPIDNDLPDNLSFSRPRPPCIIIIAN